MGVKGREVGLIGMGREFWAEEVGLVLMGRGWELRAGEVGVICRGDGAWGLLAGSGAYWDGAGIPGEEVGRMGSSRGRGFGAAEEGLMERGRVYEEERRGYGTEGGSI